MYCKELETVTFRHPDIVKFVNEHFIPLKVDKEKHPDLARRFAVDVIPDVLFIAPEGWLITRLTGFYKAPEYLPRLKSVIPRYKALAEQIKKVEATPQDAAANFAMGTKLMALGSGGKAVEFFERVVAADPKNEKGHTLRALYQIGAYHHGKGLAKLAQARFKQLAALDPKDASGLAGDVVLLEMGPRLQLMQAKKQWADAAALLEKFVKDYPRAASVATAMYRIALSYYYLQQRDKALEWWKRTAAGYPSTEAGKRAAAIVKRLGG